MQRRMLSATAVTGLGLALAVLMTSPSFAAPGATTDPVPTATPTPTPTSTQCGVIDFEKADVAPIASTETMPPSVRYRLTVSGTKSASNVTVKLVPLVYVRQPEFWGIQVIGCSSGIGLPVLMSYTVTYDFTAPMGSCGIEVIGTTKRQQFDLAACTSAPLAGTSWVLDPASIGVPVPQGSPITATFTATRVNGSTSCNTYSADYTVGTGGAFKLGPVAMTARACQPPAGTAETAFLKGLLAAKQIQVTKMELRLLAEGKTLLRFTPALPTAA